MEKIKQPAPEPSPNPSRPTHHAPLRLHGRPPFAAADSPVHRRCARIAETVRHRAGCFFYSPHNLVQEIFHVIQSPNRCRPFGCFRRTRPNSPIALILPYHQNRSQILPRLRPGKQTRLPRIRSGLSDNGRPAFGQLGQETISRHAADTTFRSNQAEPRRRCEICQRNQSAKIA